jgi:hypothetical protein
VLSEKSELELVGKLRRRLEDSFKMCLEEAKKVRYIWLMMGTSGRKTLVNTVMHLQNVLKTNFFTG